MQRLEKEDLLVENNLKVAAVQMVSGTNWQANLDVAARLVALAASDGARVVVLPEFFIRIADTKDTEFLNIIESLGEGKIQTRLAQIARENQVYLVAGTIPIKVEGMCKCYNTCIVYNPHGEKVCHYHKIHLFKFDNGEQKFDEGVTFESGNEVVTFEIEGFTFGLTVCYDLRFPELFRKMAGVDGIILPAAFVHHTGKDHWEVLLRARAIENQCYVIASGQGGVHDNGRHTFGHSMVIDPWGKVDSVLANGEGVVVSLLEKSKIKLIRSQLPALDNRRL